MQDAIAGFQTAPLWAQIAMVLFAIMVVVSLVERPIRRRRHRRRFDAMARELGQTPPAGRGWPAAFPITQDGRAFEVRYDLRSRMKGSSYRGPTGFLLITATRLAGTKWAMHQVDIHRLKGRLSRMISSKRLTGDAAFDERQAVVEDGMPVRDGWLDAPTREAIARYYDQVPLSGILWIREGELQFLMSDPWTGIDGPAIRALLQHQMVLASALDRTASRTG